MPDDQSSTDASAPVTDSPEVVAQSLTQLDPMIQSKISDNNEGDRLPDLLAESDSATNLLASIEQDADTDEDLQHVSNSASRAQYDVLRQQVFIEEERNNRVDVRLKQAVLHLTNTQTRIAALEKAMKQIQVDFYNKPEDERFDLTGSSKYRVHKHELRRSTWENFRVDKQTYDVPIESIPALEALYPRNLDSTTTKPVSEFDLKSSNMFGVDRNISSQTPERLRIRSRSLLVHLKQITGEDVEIHESTNDDGRYIAAGTVFLRPFKLFVDHETQIRESYVNLKQKFAQGPAPKKQSTENASKFKDEDLLKDLELLVEFMNHDLGPTFDLRRAIASESATEIQFADLWHLFRKGTIVVHQSDETRAYRVVNFTGGREPLVSIIPGNFGKPEKPPVHQGFVIDCLSLSCNGSDYVPQLHEFNIHRYSGPRSISSLSVFPLALHGNAHAIRVNLLKRARQFLELTGPPFSHRVMIGKTIDEPSHEVDAQVIIDMSVATQTVPGWELATKVDLDDLAPVDLRETYAKAFCKHGVEGCCGDDYISKDLDMDEHNLRSYHQNNSRIFGPRSAAELVEDDLLLLPDNIHGYVLRNRQWITMKLSDLSEVKFQNDFNDLMLSESNKETILALVQTHESTRTSGAASVGKGIDLVKGKGTGLILLLHGEPGVGKTSTAECVADRTKRPLYPITCGDIGETAMDVEKHLLRNFNLAHKWGCVLLLDEADIFLAKRNMTDLRRNAVTSVFLRSLEYYAGILFLTTNRVGSIDPAFKSRIHMSIYYPRLKKEKTVQLYETFMKRTKLEQTRLGVTSFKINKKEIIKFAKHHYRDMEKSGLETWNGRQIRNAFQAAIALVEHESQQPGRSEATPTLGAAQFKAVAKSSKEFDKYLVSTLGETETDAAQREAWRADLGRPHSGTKNRTATQTRARRGKRVVEEDTDEKSSNSSSGSISSDDDDDEEDDD